MKLNLLLTGLMLLINGCDSAYERCVLGNFYLTAADSMDDLCLSYYDAKNDVYPAIVAYGVYEVLFDDKYIVVKKHPYLDAKFNSKLDKTITEYYIVKIVDTEYYDDKDCLGPFAENEFIDKRTKLGIKTLTTSYSRQN